MEFLLLDKLKTNQEFNYTMVEFNLDLNQHMLSNIAYINQVFKDYFSSVSYTAIETEYLIRINIADQIDDEEAFFSNAVKTILAKFVDNFCIYEGRPREHRFDIPEKLLDKIMISRSLLKKMINQKTKADRINITIVWKTANENFIYELLNTKHPGEAHE